MVYELACDGYRLGIFPTEAETVHNAAYLPKSRYTLREWTEKGNFRTFAPSTNKHYSFTNYDRKKND